MVLSGSGLPRPITRRSPGPSIIEIPRAKPCPVPAGRRRLALRRPSNDGRVAGWRFPACSSTAPMALTGVFFSEDAVLALSIVRVVKSSQMSGRLHHRSTPWLPMQSCWSCPRKGPRLLPAETMPRILVPRHISTNTHSPRGDALFTGCTGTAQSCRERPAIIACMFPIRAGISYSPGTA